MVVVMFELNEVPWQVLDWWTARRPTSALAQLVGQGQAYTSVSPDEGPLSPWVTWPTVHRGVPNTVHGIAHFGQDTTEADRVAPPWWRTATDAGRRVGVFGLLHTNTVPADREAFAFFVPDIFAPNERTHPTSLEAFQAFNLRMARASARNVSTAIDRAALRFLRAAPALGLTPATLGSLAAQLVQERRRPLRRVRRRSLQSVIAFDLFERQLRSTRPDAAAFFTNHVASAMHRYWAATFPEDYPAAEFGFGDEWLRTWNGELEAAMAHADRMVARLLRHRERTGSTLIVASSMGQQAAQATPISAQLILADVQSFLAAAGIAAGDAEIRAAMVPHANVYATGEAATRLGRFVESVRIGGAPIEWSEVDGLFSLTFGHADDAIGAVTVAGRVVAPESLGLSVTAIEDSAASTGYHVAEGTLLVLRPGGTQPRTDRTDRPEVPTTAIAPTIHRLLGLDPAPHHRADPLVGC